MSACSYAVCVAIFSNGSIIPTGFKFMELHTLTLSTRFYALLYCLPITLSADETTGFQCDDACSCCMSYCVVCVGSKAVDCLMASKWTSKPPEEDEYSPYFVTRGDAVKYCVT